MEIKLRVNGIEVKLSDFPREIIMRTILAMLSTLKGVDEIKAVEILIEKVE